MLTVVPREAFTGLRALVVERHEHKYRQIEHLLGMASVSVVERLTNMESVGAALQDYRSRRDSVLAQSNVFLVDADLNDGVYDNRLGNEVVVAFAERGIAYPAAGLLAHRQHYPSEVNGVIFGCTDYPRSGAFANAVEGFNLQPFAATAQVDTIRMVATAALLLS